MNHDAPGDAPGAAPPAWVALDRDRAWTAPAPGPEIAAFHRDLEGYEPTALVELPALAAELDVGRVVAKDESSRLGLPAFKALGASWAVRCAVAGMSDAVTVVTATDGNHGRAVAHFARLLGHRAEIHTPEGVGATAIERIESEGARVHRLSGTYDEAVAEAAAACAQDRRRILVQDTSWEGYEQIPQRIVDGYDTLLTEIDQQLTAADAADLVIVPTGVGSLLQSALTHYRTRPDAPTRVVAVEPVAAACLPPSLAAGRPVTIPTGSTIMAGLNCGTPSLLAWPAIQHGLDATTSISDEDSLRAAHDLAALGVDAGPCGAASLASARVIAADPARRDHLGLGPDSTVVLLITEGTDSNPLPDRSHAAGVA